MSRPHIIRVIRALEPKNILDRSEFATIEGNTSKTKHTQSNPEGTFAHVAAAMQ